jgi:Rieske Fe-S protein
MHRRGFVQIAAGAFGAAALPACASVAVMPVAAEGGAIRLRLRDHARLAEPGGYLKLQPDTQPTPVYILAVDDGFVALSPICMHLGCTVNIEGQRLVCPCHGSMYDRRGGVLRGPTQRPLASYPTALTADGELVIRLDTQR